MAGSEPSDISAGLAHSRRAAVLMLMGFLATEMPMPYKAASLVALVPAVFESVRALRLLGRGGAPTSTRVWSGFGLVLVTVLSSVVILTGVAYAQGDDYQECLRGANTHVAVAQCKDDGGAGPLSGFLLGD